MCHNSHFHEGLNYFSKESHEKSIMYIFKTMSVSLIINRKYKSAKSTKMSGELFLFVSKFTWVFLWSLSGLYRWFWYMMRVHFVLIHLFISFDLGPDFKNDLDSRSYFWEYFCLVLEFVFFLNLLSYLIKYPLPHPHPHSDCKNW